VAVVAVAVGGGVVVRIVENGWVKGGIGWRRSGRSGPGGNYDDDDDDELMIALPTVSRIWYRARTHRRVCMHVRALAAIGYTTTTYVKEDMGMKWVVGRMGQSDANTCTIPEHFAP